MIVIVSGPPGAGKTTAARFLAQSADRGVHLVSDEFYRWIHGGFIAPHLPEAHAQNVAVMDVALATVCAYTDAGYDVYWDGVVGPWWLDQIRTGLGDRVADTHYLVLRPSKSVALDRVMRRDGTTEVSGAETMYAQFQDLGEHERHVISTDGPRDDIVEKCQSAVESREYVL